MSVTLHPYSADFATLFNKQKQALVKLLPEAQLHHIGSTAVKGLGGKGIIDILVAIPNWSQKESVVGKLKSFGFTHIHDEIRERIFLSKHAATKYGDTHLHLTYIGSSEYNSLLAFRNNLRDNPNEAQNYMRLKGEWLKKAQGDAKCIPPSKTTTFKASSQVTNKIIFNNLYFTYEQLRNKKSNSGSTCRS